MLLDSHKASFDNFSILLKENSTFKLQLKESLLISRDFEQKYLLISLSLVYSNIVTFIIFIIFVIKCQYIVVIIVKLLSR